MKFFVFILSLFFYGCGADGCKNSNAPKKIGSSSVSSSVNASSDCSTETSGGGESNSTAPEDTVIFEGNVS